MAIINLTNNNDVRALTGTGDTVNGFGGNDLLHINALNLTVNGGPGDDIYFVNATGSSVFEAIDGGSNDHVRTTLIQYVLPLNIENLHGHSGFAEGSTEALGRTSTEWLFGFFGQTLIGNFQNNLIEGDFHQDRLYGLDGNDTLNGEYDDDQLYGGRGDDRYLVLQGNDQVIENVNEGQDEVWSGVQWFILPDNVEDLLAFAAELDPQFNGGQRLTGNGQANFIRDDVSDFHNDTLEGEGGNDRLITYSGVDSLFGGDGDDVLEGNSASGGNRFSGGAGDDRIVLHAASSSNVINGDSGNDTIEITAQNSIVSGDDGDDTIVVFGASNTLIGGEGNDNFEVHSNQSSYDGGNGNDTFSDNGWLYSGNTFTGGAGDDRYVLSGLSGIEVREIENGGIDTIEILAASFDAIIAENVEIIRGLSSNGQTLTGNSSANTVYSNGGADVLNGAGGNDVLCGRAGADTLNGGDGLDLVSYFDASLGVTVSLSNPASNTGDAFGDRFVSIENLYGSQLADVLGGNVLNNAINGAGGNDSLYGGFGSDTLFGGFGDDFLTGNAERDTLTGGAGSDHFVFRSLGDSVVSARDVILDFNLGNDTIDLSTIDASTRFAGNQAFKFIGAAAFHRVAGEVRYQVQDVAGSTSDKTLVSADVNGDGVADLQIVLSGIHSLTGADFIL